MKKFYTGSTVILTRDFQHNISLDKNKAIITLEKYTIFTVVDINASWVILESGKDRYMFSNETMQEYFDIKTDIRFNTNMNKEQVVEHLKNNGIKLKEGCTYNVSLYGKNYLLKL